MDTVIGAIGTVLGAVMKFCFDLCRNYGGAILLFTLVIKVILLPLSMWVHVNGLKVIRMQPAINRLKIDHYGDKDAIAEGQAELYKKEKYNPLASLIPLFVQIIILMGVVEAIYNPLTYIVGVGAEAIDAFLQAGSTMFGLELESAQAQIQLLRLLAEGHGAEMAAAVDAAHAAVLPQMEAFSTNFLGLDLTLIPSEMSIIYLLIPIVTGCSALLLSLCQNKLNPLQHEQSGGMQWGTLAFTVGLSLYLGYFVPAGVALYWIASNLYTIVQQVLLNAVINPKKHVDYKALEATREELAQLEALDASADPAKAKELRRRESKDYKRFFSVANKHLVFYSESQGFYKYFAPVIENIMSRSNLTVHYITSDPNDSIFQLAEKNEKLRAYYIGPRKLITLFMRMDADVIVMTMSDLENYHYKRSYVRKDAHYIYMFHYPMSTHMVLHTGALDHYDEILCVGDFQIPEIRKQEELNNLPAKRLEVCGYCQLDSLYKAFEKMDKTPHERPRVLVAPSWQEDNILDTCIDPLLNSLLGRGWDVKVRPHPEYMKRYRPRMEAIMARWADYKGGDLVFETDFTSNSSLYESDVVLTDWSGTAFEFSLVTLKPAVFIDTPPKIHNPEYVKLGIEPQELLLRDQVGVRVAMNNVVETGDKIAELLGQPEQWKQRILDIRTRLIANFPDSAPASAKAILNAVVRQTKKAKENDK